MHIEGSNPTSGKTFTSEAPGLTSSILEAIANLDVSDEKIKSIIDQLNVSADAKLSLYSLSKITVKAGKVVVRIGRKILDVIVALFDEYPNAGFGLIFGAVVGFLISTIPILGQILGPVVLPVFMSFGLVMGAVSDIQDKRLANKIALATAQFEAFGA